MHSLLVSGVFDYTVVPPVTLKYDAFALWFYSSVSVPMRQPSLPKWARLAVTRPPRAYTDNSLLAGASLQTLACIPTWFLFDRKRLSLHRALSRPKV